MNFQQLRIIRELTQHNLNLSQTAHALKTSQSGLSKKRGGSGNLNNTYKLYFAPQMML